MLYKSFDDITDDSLRDDAIEFYDSIIDKESITCPLEMGELRSDIVTMATKPPLMTTQDI